MWAQPVLFLLSELRLLQPPLLWGNGIAYLLYKLLGNVILPQKNWLYGLGCCSSPWRWDKPRCSPRNQHCSFCSLALSLHPLPGVTSATGDSGSLSRGAVGAGVLGNQLTNSTKCKALPDGSHAGCRSVSRLLGARSPLHHQPGCVQARQS